MKKTTTQEDNLARRQPHQKTTSQEYDYEVLFLEREPQRKNTLKEGDNILGGSLTHTKTTSQEDNPHRRKTLHEDNVTGR